MTHFPHPDITSLDALADFLRTHGGERLYLRWSRDPEADLADGTGSQDDLTHQTLPGLSVTPLSVEDWWQDRPLRLWAARRLYDYCHLRREKAPDVQPWILTGTETARGPDNEPLLTGARPLARVSEDVITEAQHEITHQPGRWGPLRRTADQ
ncbi:DUF6098 family protein [Kitasatospora purpeofusca]|uniref:DUF6098 family protein n=1 Tax=Kitasatospora purpeofusca TaxID=67352 RepID=UPI002A5A67BF|nr:DUF6098 family protein [Kitasatospora purpeofusca]MDY0809994.1 DUF6098 family protein [Kitasatospora purpeofusca]